MNGPDDDDIRARLNSMFDDEPPMASVAVDDLARGRRLLRRRRRSAVVATATALPAVLVGGWAVGAATLGSTGSASRLQPADGSEPSDAGDDNAIVCWSGSVDLAPDGSGTTPSPGDDAGGGPAAGEPATPIETVLPPGDTQDCQTVPPGNDDCATVSLDAVPPDASELNQLGSGDTLDKGTVSSSGSGASLATGKAEANNATGAGTSAQDNDATAADGSPDSGDGAEPGVIGFCDDLGVVLQQHADPTGEHAGSMASGSAESTTGGGRGSASASIGWADGDREGQVSLSFDPSPGAAERPSGCHDPSLPAGPDVTCETRTLDDGTVVEVGHGSQNGAERITVRYDRPDGSAVWATADEATDAWWDEGRGADALTAPPMTVDDLIAMALDDAIK
jgi:hypothetical protein